MIAYLLYMRRYAALAIAIAKYKNLGIGLQAIDLTQYYTPEGTITGTISEPSYKSVSKMYARKRRCWFNKMTFPNSFQFT